MNQVYEQSDKLAADIILGLASDSESTQVNVDAVAETRRVIAEAVKLPEGERRQYVRDNLRTVFETLPRSYTLDVADLIAEAQVMTATDAKRFIGDCAAIGKQKAQAAQRRAAEAKKEIARQARANSNAGSVININDVQITDVRRDLLGAIISQNKKEPAAPVLYVRNGMLVRIKRSEKNVWSIQEVDTAIMKSIMADVAQWITVTETEDDIKQKNTFPPESVATDFLSLDEWFELPSLAEIVNCPVFTLDGNLHSAAGYSEHSRMYYSGSAEVGNTEPTRERIAWAKDMILDNLITDFPFADDASRAHALCYMLVPFVRDIIKGAVPPLLIGAPMEGSGKSLLTSACAFPALGRTIPTMAFTNDEAEMDKRITSKLMAGDTHAVLDNINHELDSGVLANAWTQTVYEGRTLGHNTMPKLENRMIWAITANNIVLSAENARRCIWVQLDANSERPRDRQGFKHAHLMTWAEENRDDLVTACITLVRAWVAEGMPSYSGKRTKGSYESWVAVMGGILDVIGINGFLDNEEELAQKAVTKTNLMKDFVNAWWERHGNSDTHPANLFHIASYYDREPSIYAEFDSSTITGKVEVEEDSGIHDSKTAKEAAQRIKDGTDKNPQRYEVDPFIEPAGIVRGMNLLDELLPAPKERGRQIQLGKLLNKHEDRIIAGLKIVKSKAKDGKTFWKLEDPTGQRGEPKPAIHGSDIDNLLNKGKAAAVAADKQQPLSGGPQWSIEM